MRNLQVLLAKRPEGWVEEDNFRIVEAEAPRPGEGQVLVRNIFLSLDPYMRGRMNEAKSYAAPAALDQVMVGETAGEVVESKSAKFKPGDTVCGYLGWQRYATAEAKSLRAVDPKIVPLSAYLGVAGMPGVTAWYGLLEIGRPNAGETVAVSAASGAVGSVVGQLAKIKNCRVVGIAGGPQKCEYVVKELGFDACVDHRASKGVSGGASGGASKDAGELTRALAKAAPGGIDVHFENVGGPVLDAALVACNPFARIAVCGMIADYNASERYGVKNMIAVVGKRIKMQGFIVSDHLERWPEAIGQLAQWVRAGKIKYRESVTQGLENAPKAFIGMFKGENFGKQLVRID